MKKKIYNYNVIVNLLRVLFFCIIVCTIYEFVKFINLSTYNIGILKALLITFISSWIVILVHELGHCIAVIKHGYRIRSIHLPFIQICFIEKIKCFTNSFIFEGMVIPEIPLIRTKKDFDDVQVYIINMLLGGPLATALFALFNFMIMRILVLYYGKSLLLEFVVLVILFESIFILYNCFRSSGSRNGDIKVVQKIEKSEFDFSIFLYEWMFYQPNYQYIINQSKYLKVLIKKRIKGLQIEKCDSFDDLSSTLYYSICGIDTFFVSDLLELLPQYMDILLNSADEIYNNIFYLEQMCYGIMLFELNKKHNIADLYYKKMQLLEFNINDKKKDYILSQLDTIMNHSYKSFDYKNHPNYAFFKVFSNHLQCEQTIFESY